MGTLMSTVAALSTFYPDAADVDDPEVRRRQILRLLGQVPTLAAFAHRKRNGLAVRLSRTSSSPTSATSSA